MIDRLMADNLVWLPEKGIGYYPVRSEDYPYDDAYFDKYAGYANTRLGRVLTSYRIELVNAYTSSSVLDLGIGCGAFIEHRNRIGCPTTGYDINARAKQWLIDRQLWCNPWNAESISSMTFWDSLEHVREPDILLARVRDYVFISTPIFEGPLDILKSKHFRRDEHYWYFTAASLPQWMESQGFAMREHSDTESQLGRESIETFVFERIGRA